MMHIVFSTDAHYAIHCATAMMSVINHATEACTFYILTDSQLPPEAVGLLTDVAKRGHDSSISFLSVPASIFAQLPIWQTGQLAHISRAAYYRLCLPLVLPAVDCVLYLDCDVIACTSLSPLYHTDISQYALAAVHQISDAGRNEKLGIPHSAGYFNSGVLLINLDYWRRHDVSQELFRWAKKHPQQILYHDQDILNAVLYDRTLALPYRWNMTFEYFRPSARYLSAHASGMPYVMHCQCLEHNDEWLQHPGIIHFAAQIKPWHNSCLHPRQPDYLHYRAMIGRPLHIPLASRLRWYAVHLFRSSGLSHLIAWVRASRP